MKVYDDKHIKNVVLLGSAKSGKTTLTETMLFEANLINRRGTVEDKNTVSDYHEIEHERGNSVYATSLHTEWRDYKINLIDTPGLDDFMGEIVSSLRVADTCLMLINSQYGVEVNTELIWNYVEKFNKPVIFGINQLDHPKSNFDNAVESVKNRFGSAVILVQYPVNQGEEFDGIIDLLKMVYYKFPSGGGKPEKLPIPDEEKDKAEQLHNELVEKAAENDEALMELYFEKGSLEEDELRKGLKIGMLQQEIFPVFCLSAKKNMGSGRLMGFIDNVVPSAIEGKAEKTVDGKEIPCDPKGKTSLFVFKTVNEPYLGKVTFFKVCTGELKIGSDLVNAKTGSSEKINQLFIMDGKNRTNVQTLSAGDIGASVKLKDTNTNNTLHEKGFSVEYQPIEFPEPRMQTAIRAKDKNDDENRRRHMELSLDEMFPFSEKNKENYDFTLREETTLDGISVYVLDAKAKQRTKDFFDGIFYIDKETWNILRAELQLAKNPGPLKVMEMGMDFYVLPEGHFALKKMAVRIHVGLVVKNIRQEVIEEYSEYQILGS